MDTLSKENLLRKQAAWLSLLVAVLVLSLKAYAYYLTRSTAILSDALESIVNVLTAVTAVVVVRYAAQPADAEHPYGHGKAEYFSAAFEGGLIFFAAVIILIESVKAFYQPPAFQPMNVGLFVMILASCLNFAVGMYLKKIGNKYNSETLLASSAHVFSDVKTSVGVLLGLGLVLITGVTWIDPLIAVMVAMHLAYEGMGIVRRSIGGLIDEMDTVSLQNLSQSIKRNLEPGIIDIHHLKSIRSGNFHHIDAHLVVPEYWDVARVHDMAHAFEQKVVRDYRFEGEIAFHLDPCKRSFCKKCQMHECSIRAASFDRPYSFDVVDLVQGPQKTN